MIIDRVRIFREECQAIGRAYDPGMVGVTRGLQIVHNEEERKRAIYNAVAELHSLARTVEQITDQVERTIDEINARRRRD